MEPKYVEVIKAGIIGGIILAALELISNIVSLLKVVRVEDLPTEANPTLTGAVITVALFGCCICILYIVVLAGTGALAVRMSKGLLRDMNDAVISSALAGAVAGLIWGVVSVVLRFLVSIVNSENTTIATKFGEGIASGTCGVCCLPVEIIIGAIIALIGGALYYALAEKN